MLFCSTMAKAQVTTEAIVTDKINTFLPTNNARGISASGLRSTLLKMMDLISRKVNNEQIIVSADGKSVKIKPAGTAAAYVPRKVELKVDFQATLDLPTVFTYDTKDVYERNFRFDISTPATEFLTGIDHLVDVEGNYVYTDANDIVFKIPLNGVTTDPKTVYNITAGTLSANNFLCGTCTAKRYEITVMYTKRQ